VLYRASNVQAAERFAATENINARSNRGNFEYTEVRASCLVAKDMLCSAGAVAGTQWG
jgi:hypothetical protein